MNAMDLLTDAEFIRLANPGVTSLQLVAPLNSPSARVTITRVQVEVGATNPRHRHDSSEQVWIALEGEGMLLLAGDETRPFRAGYVARFADGDVHGFRNTGGAPFIYLSVTAPPIDFSNAYAERGPVPR
jgi:quercetin dioxygenase-like cupin family protein